MIGSGGAAPIVLYSGVIDPLFGKTHGGLYQRRSGVLAPGDTHFLADVLGQSQFHDSFEELVRAIAEIKEGGVV